MTDHPQQRDTPDWYREAQHEQGQADTARLAAQMPVTIYHPTLRELMIARANRDDDTFATLCVEDDAARAAINDEQLFSQGD